METDSKSLFIVAAGLSTRFGGKPKHLAKVKGTTNLEHTLQFASRAYGNIYVVVNEKASTYALQETESIARSHGAKMLKILSGHGDADAVYKALLAADFTGKHASICWGDAWFNTDEIFHIAARALDKEKPSSIVFDAMCALEANPYGWFNVDEDGKILDASFASDSHVQTAYAIHDQCFFNIDVKNFKDLYEAYVPAIQCIASRIQQSIERVASQFKISVKREISWYKMINWAISQSNARDIGTYCSTVTMLDKPAALSFNTEEDLEKIENA